MKKLILFCIKIYQKIFSYDHGIIGKIYSNTRYCKFIPTCSEYTYEAIDKYGVLKGSFLGLKRIIKCNPWNECCKYDPVP